MARVAWENRDQLPFAWRILNQGICDGCALGTTGLRDWTLDGDPPVHGPPGAAAAQHAARPRPRAAARRVARCRRLTSQELRALGRLPEPMIRRQRRARASASSPGTRPTPRRPRRSAPTDPERFAVYVTSRGILNEHYYAAQKAARAMGTNHVDNSARLCHAASTVAMKRTLGYGATTCSYTDWIGHATSSSSSGPTRANNQPVTMKYLYHARQQGAKVAVVNTYVEPGLRALLGAVGPGVRGLRDELRRRLVRGRHRRRPRVPERRPQGAGGRGLARPRRSSRAHRRLRGGAGRASAAQDWEDLERESGTTRAEMRRFAEMLRGGAERRSSSGRWGSRSTRTASTPSRR